MSPREDDEDLRTEVLLQRWHAGERRALDELIGRDLEWIRARVRARLGNALRLRGETQDYVHDALIEVLRYGPRFVTANRAQFRSLLARIVENVLRDKNDHHAAQRRDLARERPLPTDSVLQLCGGSSPVTRPSEAAMRAEREAWVRLALELLEPDDRKVILLRQHDGLSFAEVGARLGVSENTARMRFQRALPRLAHRAESLAQGGLGEI